MKKKIYIAIFITVWLLVILIPPYIVFKTAYIPELITPAYLLKLVERVSGVFAFGFLFTQVVIGLLIERLSKLLGPWIYKFHGFQAINIFALILTHIFSYVFFVKKIKGLFDPFYPFTDLCILCKNVVYPEWFVNFGRIALWIITFATGTVLVKNSSVWLKNNWKKVQALNLLAFLFVGAHAWLLGGDFQTKPLNYLFFSEIAVVILLISSGYVSSRLREKLQE